MTQVSPSSVRRWETSMPSAERASRIFAPYSSVPTTETAETSTPMRARWTPQSMPLPVG